MHKKLFSLAATGFLAAAFLIPAAQQSSPVDWHKPAVYDVALNEDGAWPSHASEVILAHMEGNSMSVNLDMSGPHFGPHR